VAAEFAALPYDTFSRAEAAAEIAAHPLSFLRIDKPAALFGDEVGEADARVYERARDELNACYEQGVVVPDSTAGSEQENLPPTPIYGIYRLTQGSHAQIGVVACASIADYQTGVIRRHENTLAEKERDRVEHIQALEAHTGPVLLTYPDGRELDELLVKRAAEMPPLYDFVAPDGVRHEFWRVGDEHTVTAIRSTFAALSALYIADGHHRAAAAARVAELWRQPQANYFLVALFSSNQLRVLDYNRVISDLAGLSPEQLLGAIREVMDLEPVGARPARPRRRGEIALYLDGMWYRLVIREAQRPADPVEGLDVALLHSSILAPVLKLTQPRSDPRVSYVGGVRGLDELAVRADETGGVAFALYPCSLSQLFAVADAGRLMPPKSTWFEPKPRSGLALHPIGKGPTGSPSA
jgi:uncharacterized protein (DUF1015 family)